MRVSVLTENTSACGFETEHGLSLYIETKGKKVLFDSGQSGLFADNADRMGVDLSAVDIAVLSHGHYDHGGGLKRFLELNDRAKIYMNRFAFEPHFNTEDKYIGLDPMLSRSNRIVLTEGTTQLTDSMTLFDCNSREKAEKTNAFGLQMLENGVMKPDDFRHEQYLLIRENGKKILFSGCSHKGIVNIVEWFKPDVLVGGFHLMKLPADESLQPYADRLNGYDTEYYTCHCTGVDQYEYLRRVMLRLHYLSTGQIFEL